MKPSTRALGAAEITWPISCTRPRWVYDSLASCALVVRDTVRRSPPDEHLSEDVAEFQTEIADQA